MNLSTSLFKRSCPLCYSTNDDHVYFKENIDESKLNNLAFSSRKTPEFMNFQLVRCQICDLLYADSIPSGEFLQSAYQSTGYDSNEEAQYAAKSYAKWLNYLAPNLIDLSSTLEIGSGNGAFLQHLLDAGFQEVIGVEPSTDAISAAPQALQQHIRKGMFNVNEFPENHFSLITIFQTLEHINDPAQFFSDAIRLIKPGGALMLVAHNYRHWLMRLLGKNSPIVDIEHLQLFSPKSLRFSLDKAGFENIEIHSLSNAYPLHYWTKLLPLRPSMKQTLHQFIKHGRGRHLGAINISMSVGNMVAWAFKQRS